MQYQRPNPGETDEDLIRLQEEYYKQIAAKKVLPAAKLVKNPDRGNEGVNQVGRIESIEKNVNVHEHLSNTFEDVPTTIKIGSVIAKKRTSTPISFANGLGFPRAKRRDVTIQDSSGSGSIFSRQMKKLKRDLGVKVQSELASASNLNVTERNLPTCSFIVTGADKEMIHSENLDIIKRMPEHQILEEKAKLIESIDPAIIAFLKSRRTGSKRNESRVATITEQNKAGDEVNLDELETMKDILNEPASETWLNFDVIESNKLAWMKDVPIERIPKEKAYEARFDFEGWLLPFKTDINETNRALFHHGEEPDRPGYTLQELFQLCRSNIIQQKIVALNTISNILRLASSGVYDQVIDLPNEQIFFVVRFCLDENAPGVLNAAIKALRSLFYHPIDEVCLDNRLGFGELTQAILSVDEVTEDDETVNDQQLVETNLVQCLARTEIFTRIRYIFNAIKPPLETVVACLEILIRLVRDCDYIAETVYRFDGLILSVVENFVPKIHFEVDFTKSETYSAPVVQALKFLRVLSCRNKKFANGLIKKFNLMERLATYLSSESIPRTSTGLKLQIESLHLFRIFLRYNLCLEYLTILEPILIRAVIHHLDHTNSDDSVSYTIQSHVAAFLNLFPEAGKTSSGKNFYTVLLGRKKYLKWIRQFEQMRNFSCGKLQIVSSLLNALTAGMKLGFIGEFDEIKSIILSEGFNLVTQNMRETSNLLNNYETHKTNANFKYSEAPAWNAPDRVVPVIGTRSPFPFLTILSSLVLEAENKQLNHVFLNHPNVAAYLRTISDASEFHLAGNWYTKIETGLLSNILRLAVISRREIDVELYHTLAVKTLSVFDSDHTPDIEYIMERIVFSVDFYPATVLLDNLKLTVAPTTNEVLSDCFNHLDEIRLVYNEILGLKHYASENLSKRITDNAIPIDWIYSPIVALYSNESATSEERRFHVVRNCLRWVYMYERCFETLAAWINPTEKFCRLCCVFLGSDSLFLEPEIQRLLRLLLQMLLSKSGDKINFKSDIRGLNNFEDFYTQLLEQYQGVSYGDLLFANFILVPLAQRHDVKFRKALWSEYAGILEVCNLSENDVLSEMGQFYEPIEADPTLVKCYQMALIARSVRRTSVFYKIAEHHVKAFSKKVQLEQVS